MNGTNLDTNSACQLGNALKENTALDLFEMNYNNNMSSIAFKELFYGLGENKSIRRLYLNENKLGEEGAKYLGQCLAKNRTILNLYIDKNELNDNGLINLISEGLKFNNILTTLSLNENGITQTGLKALVLALNNKLLLDDYLLSLTKVRSEGVSPNLLDSSFVYPCSDPSPTNALRPNLKNILVRSAITKLFIRNNILNTHEAAEQIRKLINDNKIITYLDLGFNNLSDVLIETISRGLHNNKTIETLILESNPIGANGTQSLCNALKTNTAVSSLNLRNNSLGHEGAKHISELITINKTLKEINLQYNSLDEHSISLIADKIGYNSELKSINVLNNQMSNIQDIIANLNFAKDIIIC
jgi:Ran GTPase-activating protein (RanGAP) involved in mRNA processing and transport